MTKVENANEQFISDRELRDRCVGRYEVLEKVKELFLLSDTKVATVKMVADYYEVNEKAIEKIYIRHADELENDGMCTKKYSELSNLHYVGMKTFKGKVTLIFSDGTTFDYPTRGAKIFPRRAILRIGMLLRDSVVAKEVRNQLLNIEENVSNDIKVQDINEEQKLMLNIGMAYASGNVDAIMRATTEYNAFQNQHIKKLEQDNKALSGEILSWSDRSKLNSGIRMLSKMTHIHYAELWNELYRNLQYKYSIALKRRGKSPYIQHIKEDEWNKVIKVFSAMCEAYGYSPTDMIRESVIQD